MQNVLHVGRQYNLGCLSRFVFLRAICSDMNTSKKKGLFMTFDLSVKVCLNLTLFLLLSSIFGLCVCPNVLYLIYFIHMRTVYTKKKNLIILQGRGWRIFLMYALQCMGSK